MTDLPARLAQRISDATAVYPAGSRTRNAQAAESMRLLAESIVGAHADPGDEVVDLLAAAAARVSPAATRFGRASARADGLATFPMGTHPIAGRANPLAPPVDVDLEGDTLVGLVTYDATHEGLPGSVFGGFIAAGFDAVLGIRAALVGTPCSAARLTTDFRAATPLHVPLRYEADVVHVADRKIRVAGRLRVVESGIVTAEGEALFLSVDTTDVTTERPAGFETTDCKGRRSM